MNALPLQPDAVPLDLYEGKVYRVRGTRVPLQTVVEAFNLGMSAEGIADAFPSLDLPDVYAVIAYYLRHRSEVDEHLAHLGKEGERRVAQATGPAEYQAWREQLLARSGRAAKAGKQMGLLEVRICR
jgi:uncharacterized protein (DUF433 family)